MDDDHNQRRNRTGSTAPDAHSTPRLPSRSGRSAADLSNIEDLQRRLDSCQEIAGIGDWVYDAASGAVTWSREVLRMMKRASRSGQMSFDEFLFYYEAADSERLLDAMEAVILENRRREVEMRARLLDGESVRHGCTLLPLSNRFGVVTGVNGFLRDLGALDHAGEGESDRIPARMVGVDTGDVVFRLLIPEGVCEYISPAITEVSGRPPRDWYRIPFLFREIVHPDWADRFNKKFEGFLAGDAPEEHVFPIIHPSGEVRWIRIRAVAAGESKGSICAIEGIAADITAMVREESKRKRLIRQLRKVLSWKKTLNGLLPICSFCKKVRDDQGLWTQIESYLTENCDLYFTHGLCPDCLENHYPEYNPQKRHHATR